MQTGNPNFREKNVVTDKKYILRKKGWKFQSPKFSISWKVEFYICFVIKFETFGAKKSITSFWSKQKWINKTACFNFLRN